jgi:hypothetical protein
MSRLQREYPVATAPGSDLVAKRYSISRLRRDDGVEEKVFWDDLSNSVQPFDYMVKAGQTARPKIKIKTVTGEKKNHASVSGC